MLTQWSTRKAKEELEKTSDILESITGERPPYFRPPFLLSGLGLGRVVAEMEMQAVGISAGTNDWEQTNPQVIADDILENIAPGGIIILHDGDGGSTHDTPQGSRAPSVAASEIIIKTLKEKGYEFSQPGALLTLGQP